MPGPNEVALWRIDRYRRLADLVTQVAAEVGLAAGDDRPWDAMLLVEGAERQARAILAEPPPWTRTRIVIHREPR